MSPLFERKELFNQILWLGEEEVKDPFLVFERFFTDYRLYECRYTLWSMVETCLTTDNTEFSDPEERANLLLRSRHFEQLMEAGYLLLQVRNRQMTGG